MQGERAGKFGFSGKLCAKLMEVWLEHKVVILSLAKDARDLQPATQQPEKAATSCKLKWFLALRIHAPHSIPKLSFSECQAEGYKLIPSGPLEPLILESGCTSGRAVVLGVDDSTCVCGRGWRDQGMKAQ